MQGALEPSTQERTCLLAAWPGVSKRFVWHLSVRLAIGSTTVRQAVLAQGARTSAILVASQGNGVSEDLSGVWGPCVRAAVGACVCDARRLCTGVFVGQLLSQVQAGAAAVLPCTRHRRLDAQLPLEHIICTCVCM